MKVLNILVPTVMLTQVSISIFCWKGTADPDLRQGDDWVTSVRVTCGD